MIDKKRIEEIKERWRGMQKVDDAKFVARARTDIPYLLEAIEAYLNAEEQGLLIKLPCMIGDTVYVVSDCDGVTMTMDDDYFTGTGAVDCPYEGDCEFEDCEETNRRVFESEVTDFWVGKSSGKNSPDVFIENMNKGFMFSDFGKVVFLSREEAESALRSEEERKRCCGD